MRELVFKVNGQSLEKDPECSFDGLDEAGNVVTATFKTPPEIASNSKAVWSRWYKINGIGV